MANSNKTNERNRSSGNATASKNQNSGSSRDDNVALRAARTVRDRPYASAAIATGAVTAVAAAAAGAFFFTRRDKSFKEASDELSARVKGSFAGASSRVKEFAGRGDDASSASPSGNGRTQQEIAQEALSLKESGAASSSLDHQSNSEIKAGAIAY